MEKLERVVPTSLENAISLYNQGGFSLDLKTLDVSKKAEIIKYALTLEDLDDPLMLLNILNLIKSYNTLDEKYFEAPDIYVNSVEELLDLKLSINKEVKVFSQKLIKYFFGLLKALNKTTFTPADEHIELPNVFKNLFLLLDLNSISAIFAKCDKFSTDEIIYVDNAYMYISSIMLKSVGAINLLEEFYTKQEVKQ